jgi:hypothetical protein
LNILRHLSKAAMSTGSVLNGRRYFPSRESNGSYQVHV